MSRTIQYALKTAVLIFCLMGGSLRAQTNTYTYRFEEIYASGTMNQLRYDAAPDVNAQALFPGMTSSEQWAALLESGYVLGTGGGLTRAQDVSEDWHLNWINPEESTWNYYDEWWISGQDLKVLASGYPRTLANQGSHAGESILLNPNILGMGDDNFLFWDPEDQTLSVYNYPGGTLEFDYTWTEFSSGYWAGETLASKLHLLIGYEEGNLYFLEGDSLMVRYNLAGTSGNSFTVEFAPTSDLAGWTLGDVVDGRVDGFTYIGWDVGAVVIGTNATLPVPEPSGLALLAMGGLTLVLKRRVRR
jgi:hypothetical protein